MKTELLQSAAHEYLNAGLCVLPAIRAQKRPAIGSWKHFRDRLPTPAELNAWFANPRNIPDAVCIVCGAVSNNTEIIDFDGGGELFGVWWEKIPTDLHDRLVIEVTPSGGYHVIYRCESPVCGNMKLAQRKVDDKITTLIETRGEGGLFLCAPTMGYVLGHGDLTNLPVLTADERDALLQAAWDLNEHQLPVVDGPSVSVNSRQNGALSVDNSHNGESPSDNSGGGNCPSNYADRPGDDFNNRGDVRAVLQQHGWSRSKTGGCGDSRDSGGSGGTSGGNEYWRRPGKESGTSATLKGGVFYVFSSNAPPFEPYRGYSPFAVYALLNHGGDFEKAARTLRHVGYGGDGRVDHGHDVNISGIVGHCGAENSHIGDCGAEIADIRGSRPEITDPGPMPAEMLRVPGFVSEVMDHTLAIAPYPNPVMAFAGALALQAVLAGRKVRDPGDNRTNIYLLGLAHSSAGKDQSRKVNTDVLHAVGMADSLGLHFASGEGLQDALFQTPTMLFQTDEIDGMLQSINKAKDARHEAIMGTMLTMYSSANSVFPMRRKAGKESPGVIDQPCLVIYGTAIPNHYYEALSERMLTNGFFARMIILESGPRPAGQEPGFDPPPPRVLATAKWWTDYQPGERRTNLLDIHPVPAVVEHTDEARRLLVETRKAAEAEYTTAETRSDPVGTTVWGRVSEQTRKLALLYAISENHQSPRIGIEAVRWAAGFVMHQTRRMLYMAAGHVAENPFHAECLKAVEKLRNAPGHELPHSVLLKRMKTDSKTFTVLIETLTQQGDIEIVTGTTAGRPSRMYRLPGGVNLEGETSSGGET